MSDDELLKITDSMQQKLGAENAAVIADDIGLLISGNSACQRELNEKQAEIDRLKNRNEQLITANGNLLQRIPVENHSIKKEEPKDESKYANISLDSLFENGKFK